VIGGRTAAYERALAEARRLALEAMEEHAHDLGADAVLAVRLESRLAGAEPRPLAMVSASGTAVKLSPLAAR
jgi:uncharacterized protein YbjQ (UPF0145 family)